MTDFENIVKHDLKYIVGRIKEQIEISNRHPCWTKLLANFLADINKINFTYNIKFDQVKKKVEDLEGNLKGED